MACFYEGDDDVDIRKFREYVTRENKRAEVDPECDFCSSRQIAAWYFTEDLTVMPLIDDNGIHRANFVGDEWAACVDCDALILAKEWEPLARKCMMVLASDRSAVERARLYLGFLDLVRKFGDGIKERKPWTPGN